jgi:hypothetical protein
MLGNGIVRNPRTFWSYLNRAIWLLTLLMAFEPVQLFAQTATGSVSGGVSDATGAVLVGAKLSLINTATGEARNTTSNGQGYYSFPLLPPATYQVKVTMQGFEAFVRQQIVVNVGSNLTVNAPLTAGNVTQTVEVNVESEALETQTSSLGELLDTQKVTDLPMNGRNSYGFATLVPGVNASADYSQTAFDEYNDQFVSINGSRPNANIYFMDGGINTEPGFNGPGYYPSVDLVDQYKVQTNNFSAEFSDTAGGVVNVITKQGTNAFHGTAYDFYRSVGLSADNFFSKRAGQTNPFTFQQFGVALGGPIKKDKTFFFFSYEGLRWSESVTSLGTVPTALQRAGDFSQTLNSSGAVIPIYDPFSTYPDPSNPSGWARNQFPGNKITNLETLNPIASNILNNYIPLPTSSGVSPTGVNNFTSTAIEPIIKNDFSLRIDQSLKGGQLFGRWSISDDTDNAPDVYGTNPKYLEASPTIGANFIRIQQGTFDYTKPLKSTLVLQLNTSFLRYWLGRVVPEQGISPTTLGYPSYFSTLASLVTLCPGTAAVNGMGITLSVGNTGGGFFGEGCSCCKDVYQWWHNYGNLTYVRGAHVIKMGADYGIGDFSSARYLFAFPSLTFATNFTQGPDPIQNTKSGIGTASFLLGTGTGSMTGPGPDQIITYPYYGVYVQDDWKITHRLTVNAGIRYDYNAPWRERFNRINFWNPTATSPLQASGVPVLYGGLAFPGVNGNSRYPFNPTKLNFAPRTGFSLSLSSSTVLRGGYGLFIAPIDGAAYNAGVPASGFQASTPWVSTLNNATVVNSLSNPFPTGFITPPGSSQGLATLLGQSIVAMNRNRPAAYSEQWNLDFQQVVFKDLLLDVAYAGSHGVHLYAQRFDNQLPDADLALGAQLNQLVPNPFYGNPLISTGNLTNPTIAQSQLLLPHPQFVGLTLENDSTIGKSDYNALQFEVQKRFSKGFSVTGAYTWSKLMDNIPGSVTGFPGGSYASGAIQDFYNLPAEWAPATFDVTQYLAINGSWALPFGKNKALLNHGGIEDIIVGGWQINGIKTAASGSPLTMTTATNTLYNNGGTQRANWNGQNPKMPGKTTQKISEYFNVSDFSAPAPFTYGNSARTLGYLRAPGVANMDLSAIKNTKIHEQLSLQLRVEAFNLFNRVLFTPPNTVLNSGTTGVISSQFNLPREIQIAAKLNF